MASPATVTLSQYWVSNAILSGEVTPSRVLTMPFDGVSVWFSGPQTDTPASLKISKSTLLDAMIRVPTESVSSPWKEIYFGTSAPADKLQRSEERRVGKECRSRWS